MYHPYHMMRALSLHKSKKEEYNGSDPPSPDDDLIMGLTPLVFVIVYMIVTFLWVYSLYLLVKYWDVLPPWIKVVGIICLLLPAWGSLISILLILTAVGSIG